MFKTKSVRIIEADAEILKMIAAASGRTISAVVHECVLKLEKAPPAGMPWIKTTLRAMRRRR